MIPNAQLERLIERERYAEILGSLTARQLAVVALRMDDLTMTDAGELLGLSRQCAHGRLESARNRLLCKFPDLSTRVRWG